MKLASKSRVDAANLPFPETATLARIAHYLVASWPRPLGVVACIAGASALSLVPAWLIKQVIDIAIPRKDVPLLWLCCAGMIAGPLVSGLLQLGKKYGAEAIAQQVMLDLRVALYRHLHAMPFSFFATQKSGEAVSHVLNDVQGVGSAVSGTLVDIVQNSVILVSTIGFVVVALDWRLAVMAAAFLPFFVLPTRGVGRTRKQLKREAQATVAELTTIVMETLSVSGALLVKLYGTADTEARRFSEKAEALRRLSLQQTLVGRWFNLLLGVLEAIGPALVFAFGGWLVIRGHMPIGTIVAFIAVMKRIYSPASELMGVRVDLLTSYAYFERVFSVLDREPAIREAPQAVALERAIGRIELRDLSFSYDGARAALSGVNLAVPPGARVGIVGRSGAGKTTMAALMARLYDATDGSVLLDGHDIRKLTQSSLRANVALVTQETFLFHTTVLENLRYGRPAATRAEVEAAARRAQIHDVIAVLPEGYDTLVGERGYRFSAGERQRLALARVMLKNPRVVIFDEPTSALDSVSERLVNDALREVLRGRTSFVIAHRLATIRDADLILVLDNGCLVEQGTHAQLLAEDGVYAWLWQAQERRTRVTTWLEPAAMRAIS